MSDPIPLDGGELGRHALPPIAEDDKAGHGTLLLIAGSREVPGAVLLAGEAGMRAGAGRLQCAVPRSIAVQLGVALPFAMVSGHAEDEDGGLANDAIGSVVERLERVDAVVAGPGMTNNAMAAGLAAALLESRKPLALDAALLHALPAQEGHARKSSTTPLLLPHAGELASLLECEVGDVERDPLAAGRACAAKYDALVLVKGAKSHIVAPDGETWRYEGGGPGLGVSGSGDVLAGIVGGLLARGADGLSALLWAVALHGNAGRRLAHRQGTVGFLASELPAEIPALLPS